MIPDEYKFDYLRDTVFGVYWHGHAFDFTFPGMALILIVFFGVGLCVGYFLAKKRKP